MMSKKIKILFLFTLILTSLYNNYSIDNKPHFEERKLNHSTEYILVKFFLDKGLTLEQSSGIVGNLYVESKYDIEAVGDNGTSYGIAQWHKNRKNNLLNWLKQNNLENTLENQLEYLWWELNNKEKKAFNKLKSSTTVKSASKYFAQYYERPYSKNYIERINKSIEIKNKYEFLTLFNFTYE